MLACLSALMLSACQTAPQKSVEKPLETQSKESDLVIMPSKASGKKVNSSYQLKTMTLDELRTCAKTLYDIKEMSTALTVKNTELEKRKLNLSQTEQSLIDRRLKIDTHNTKLIKEFNQDGKKYMESVKQLQMDINNYNKQANKTNLENNAYSANCTNRTYKASDLNQLPPDLIAVMQSASQTLDIPIFENTSSHRESDNSTNNGQNSTLHLPGSSRK
ncbi:hypothetical protein C2U68_03455 [Methylomonas koyamae]|nr:hypothetical protein C2U68_03455 [Methylomonas koyamae]